MSVTNTLTPASRPVLEEESRKYFTFVNLIIVLTAATFFELIIIVMPFPSLLLMWGLIGLSLVKFVGVVWWFMHLRWDQILLTLVFLVGLIIATGTVAALMLLFEEGGPEVAEEFQV